MLVLVSLTGVSLAADLGAAPLHALAAPASTQKIGDYVWYDANADGFFNRVGDPVLEDEYTGGINNVRLNLYKDTNGNNQIDPGEFQESTLTGQNPNDPDPALTSGWYEFEVLSGATYWVEVDASNFAPGGALVGKALTNASAYASLPVKVVIPLVAPGDRKDIDFGYVESGVSVVKTLLTSNSPPIKPGDTVSFQIVVTNIGKLNLTTVPLWDYYGPACLTFQSATALAPTTVDASLGTLYWANVGPLTPNQAVTVIVNFVAGSPASTAMYWKEGGWPDYAPKGMPDFGQKQDAWGQAVGQPAVWQWSHCGPVAAANSLWWFDSKFETKTIPPPTVSDTYPLVKSYAVTPNVWDDHSPRNVEPLVNALATQMGTNPTTGTTVPTWPRASASTSRAASGRVSIPYQEEGADLYLGGR